jgi:hypothetical protein
MDSPPTSRPALRRRVLMTIGARKGEGKGHLSTAAAERRGDETSNFELVKRYYHTLV